MGSLAPTNWELPFRNTRSPASIICKQCFWKGALLDNYIFCFLILNNTFCLSRCIEPFPYCSISQSDCSIFYLLSFCVTSILLVCHWGHMNATILPLTLSNGLPCAHKLRASILKHKVSCFHHMQTVFLEGSIVRQLYLFFFLFWLTRFVF